MKLVFAVLAQSVSLDQMTGRLSLFNLVEGIQAARFPTVLAEIAFVAVLRREAADQNRADATLTVRIGETIIGLANIAVDFQDKQSTRLIGNFQGLPVLTPGMLEFSLAIPNNEPIKVSVEAMQSPVPIVATATH
jgi:hypothetical protein